MGGKSTSISNSEPRVLSLRVQQSTYGLTIPVVYGRTRISGNLIWYGDFTAIARTEETTQGGKGGGSTTQSSTTYTYDASVMMMLCEGPISQVTAIWRGKQKITPGEIANGETDLDFANGNTGQAVWSHLTQNHGPSALGYSEIAYAYATRYPLADNAELTNHSFEVQGGAANYAGTNDATPDLIIHDLLTNAQYSGVIDASTIAPLNRYSDYVRAMELFLSPAYTEQDEARNLAAKLLKITNSEAVVSDGLIKIVPYGDEAVTSPPRDGVTQTTYTPSTTPVYELDAGHFITNGASQPVRMRRKSPRDSKNIIRIEFQNRANGYNLEIAEAQDLADIETHGKRPSDVIKAHEICDASVARRVAQLLLQREVHIKNTFEFTLSWQHSLLEPMDIVTLTEPSLGIDQRPVIIVEISEASEGEFDIVAEDYPAGVAADTIYESQTGVGFQADYNADPGDVLTPVLFEPAVELAPSTGLEVWCAVTGQSSNWGGCYVWASLDGASYKRVGEVRGGARYGRLTSNNMDAGTGTADVLLYGNNKQMYNATTQEAQALQTLCWAYGSKGGEFFAYEVATLTGVNSYSLSGLVRGAYENDTSAKLEFAPFVRVDSSIVKGDPLPLDFVGNRVYFKFQSFNIYGGGLQDISELAEYSHVVTGDQVALPPRAFDNVSVLAQPDGTRQYNFSYDNANSPPDWRGCEIRYTPNLTSTEWDSMTRLQDATTFYTASPVELNAPFDGEYRFAFRSLDAWGALSEPKYININLPKRRTGNVWKEYQEHLNAFGGGTINMTVLSDGSEPIATLHDGIASTTGYILEADDYFSNDWDNAPAWDSWDRWNRLDGTQTHAYASIIRDLGVVITGSIDYSVEIDGDYTVELRHGNTPAEIQAASWGSGADTITARYIQVQVYVTPTVTHPVPTIRRLNYSFNATIKEEYINDLDISALSGVNRIGVGDIRIPLTVNYLQIKSTIVIIQDASAGQWTYQRIDNAATGPRIQFKLNGTLADPALVDFHVRGV